MEWYYIIGTVLAALVVLGLIIKGVVFVMKQLSHKVDTRSFEKTKDDLYDKFNDLNEKVGDIAVTEGVIQEKVGNIETTQGETKITVGKIWDHLQQMGAK